MAKLPYPPGPSGYLLPQIQTFQRDPLKSIDQFWKVHGDIIRIPILPGFSYYVMIHPRHAEQMLATKGDRYVKPDLVVKSMGLLQGKGLFTNDGESWQQHRRLMQPAFQRKALEELHQVIVQAVQDLIQQWENQPEDEPIDIAAAMIDLSLKMVSRSLFGLDISQSENRVGQAFRTALAYVYSRISNPISPPLWLPTPHNRTFRQAKQILDDTVTEIIRSRREGQTNRVDLLAMLLDAQDSETGIGMSDQQIRDEIFTLLNAGYETVATSLAWTWKIIASQPEIADNLHQEVSQRLNGQPPTLEQLSQLDYTRRVFDESLRLYPPGLGQPRSPISDDHLDGYHVPKGSMCIIATYFTMRHPEFWDNPWQFDPDRFLPAPVAQRHKYAYIPFGAGPHICIGKSLALMEALTALSMISQRFKIELTPGQSFAIDPRFTLRPANGVQVQLQQRQ
ncbi:cytochrome P450 [filamentous cyanobacterium LEGE 11480]|uniref:Cytochrome P450 n=1 Tax=Romeriopsis navalis LEGE 11480 TaxID=2777977 RepID=A0A928VLQ3_9CYAN|nr:cytochrome P450 [Romeriopsis navalis]MBE9028687.1 cytochrome P450 [Romeriopsis navalis LEGE 11480]